jgi:hypothetical protein
MVVRPDDPRERVQISFRVNQYRQDARRPSSAVSFVRRGLPPPARAPGERGPGQAALPKEMRANARISGDAGGVEGVLPDRGKGAAGGSRDAEKTGGDARFHQ